MRDLIAATNPIRPEAKRAEDRSRTPRFWFTDLAHVSPDNPTRILEKVFFTPKDFEEGALYGFRE